MYVQFTYFFVFGLSNSEPETRYITKPVPAYKIDVRTGDLLFCIWLVVGRESSIERRLPFIE